MNNDLISREALKKKLQARHDNGEEDFDNGYNIGIEAAIELLDNAPTVEERPQGEWKEWTDERWGGTTIYCPYCRENALEKYIDGLSRQVKSNFCPNCGASMKGGAE